MNDSEIRKGERVFYDDVYFPKGFSRSDEFSITEASLLQDYGTTLKQLYDGFLSPQSEAEKRFVKVSNGHLEANSSIERVWIKYINATCPRIFHSRKSKNKSHDSNDIQSSEYSMEL